MIRLAHTADAHVGLYRHGRSLDETIGALDRFREYARSCDIAIVAGDLLESRHPTNAEKRAVAGWVRRVADDGTPLVITEGNHDGKDVPGDPATATLGWLRELAPAGVHVMLDPWAKNIRGRSGREAIIAALPFPHKRVLDTVIDGPVPIGERTEATALAVEAAIATLLRGIMVEPMAAEIPRILVSHLSVAGSRLGAESTMRAGYGDAVISADALRGWDYVALGHLHRQQPVPGTDKWAWYAGSLNRHDSGDAGQFKGWLDVAVERHQRPLVTPVDSGTRNVVVVEFGAPWEPRGDSWSDSPIVYARLLPDGRTPAPQRAERAIARALREGGASWVETRVIRPDEDLTERPRIADRSDPLDAVAQWIAAKVQPEPERERRIMALAAAIIEGQEVPTSLGL